MSWNNQGSSCIGLVIFSNTECVAGPFMLHSWEPPGLGHLHLSVISGQVAFIQLEDNYYKCP